MIAGERCTRACGFCATRTAKPGPLDPEEPQHVAEAVVHMKLRHAVITMVTGMICRTAPPRISPK